MGRRAMPPSFPRLGTKMKTIRIKTNLIFGIVAMLFAGVLWFLIPSQVPASKVATEYVDGSFMPKLMSIVMGLCGLVCLLRSIIFKDHDEKEITCEIEIKNCLYLGMVIAYGLLAIYASFLLASLAFGCGSLCFMKCRNFKKYILVTIVILAVTLVFKYGLKVRFGGLWGF